MHFELDPGIGETHCGLLKFTNLPKPILCYRLRDMNMKTAGIILALLALLMILMGLGVVSIPSLNPPLVSGIAFALIAYMFYVHKH